MSNFDCQLYAAVSAVYECRRAEISVSPSWLATEAMVEIAFPIGLHELGYIGCHLYMRQIARSFCARKFDPVETEQPDIFADTLQARYPKMPTSNDAEPQYIKLEHLTQADIAYNVDRLRKEAHAKLKHADVLEAYSRQRLTA